MSLSLAGETKKNQVSPNPATVRKKIDSYFSDILFYAPFQQFSSKDHSILTGSIWLKRSRTNAQVLFELRAYANDQLFQRIVVKNQRLFLIDSNQEVSEYPLSDHPAGFFLQNPISWKNVDIKSEESPSSKEDEKSLSVTLSQDDVSLTLHFLSYAETGNIKKFMGWEIKEPSGDVTVVQFDPEGVRIGDPKDFVDLYLFKVPGE
jgi:hypothetical protein